jgi:hypothetical protein
VLSPWIDADGDGHGRGCCTAVDGWRGELSIIELYVGVYMHKLDVQLDHFVLPPCQNIFHISFLNC